MASRRISNPEAEELNSAVDSLVAGSAAAVDLAFQEQEVLKADIRTIEQIRDRLSDEDPPRRLPREVQARLQDSLKRAKTLDGLIAKYTTSTVARMNEKLDRLEASPMSALRRDEIRGIRREVFKIGKFARRKGIDPRIAISSALGGILTLEQDITIYAPVPDKKMSRAEEAKAKVDALVIGAKKRWGQIKKHSIKHQVFFIRGAEVYHKTHGVGKIIENDGRRVVVAFEDGERKMTRDQIIPADIAWVDRQFSAIEVKLKRGREVTKSDMQRIIKRMRDIHNRTKQRAPLRTYSESKRALTSMVGKIQTRLTGDKMDKDTVESFLHELEEFQVRIPSAARSEWSKVDQRQWASDVNAVRKSLIKLRRKANPCIGFHFHGKDADELLKAIEKSNGRQGKGLKKKTAKSNPNGNTVTAIVFKVGKKPKKVKSVWSAIEIAATVGGTKREFVPLGGDSGYMVFAKKPLGHENERNDEATTTAGKRGHRPEIFGTAVLVPPSHRDEAFNASIGRQSRYGESPTERNPSKKKGKSNPGCVDLLLARKNPAKKKPLKVSSLTAFKKLPKGTLVTVRNRTGYVVRDYAGMNGLHAAPKSWFEMSEESGDDPLSSGARYFFDEDLEKYFRSGREDNPKNKVTKKKVTKKKAARKKTPPWQLLINRCQKLWDHYCERPSKTRLKPVLEHLEKMKASTSKKVADERKACLRVANKEARRLKMK